VFLLKVKDIDQSNFAGEIARISDNYVMYSVGFKTSSLKIAKIFFNNGIFILENSFKYFRVRVGVKCFV
jgi:hypothetical protein